MTSRIRTDILQDLSGNTGFHITNVTNTSSRYVRQIINAVDTADRSAGTGWTLGYTTDIFPDFKAGSILRIFYSYPTRNDSTGWGGLYFEPQIRLSGVDGVWYSLGSRGYDAVMDNGVSAIGHTNNMMMFDPGQTVDFSVQMRFYFRSYDGTVGLNNALAHELNSRSGTATLADGFNGLQHYGHFMIEELALFRGMNN